MRPLFLAACLSLSPTLASPPFSLRPLEAVSACFPASEAVLRPALLAAARALTARGDGSDDGSAAAPAARVSSLILAGTTDSGLDSVTALLALRLGGSITLDLLVDTSLPGKSPAAIHRRRAVAILQ